MIEKYIEKDIMRQIKVMEYLFEQKKIQIADVADFLEVSKITIKRDIEKILFIEPRINVIFENSSTIEVQFYKNAKRYELVKKIYYESAFLRVCAFYLVGKTNYMEIVEREHISIAKAFQLKKEVEDFFIHAGIMDESKEFLQSEIKLRLVILTIWMRIDAFDQCIDYQILYEAEEILKKFTKEFFNTLNIREAHFFKLAVYLSLKRKNNLLDISKREFKYIQKGILYPKIEKILSRYQLNENEVVFIAMMYSLLDQNLHNYQYLIIDYRVLRKVYIDDIPNFLELIHMFELFFNRELLKDIMFEKPFLRFITSIFLDRQMFLVEKHYFLNLKQRKLYQDVKNIMFEWNEKHHYEIELSKRTLEKFCLQVSESLLHSNEKKWNVFVVAEEEYSHIIYREWLERKVNTEYIFIDSVLYYSIDSLPAYVDAENSIIICERTLMQDIHGKIRDSETFPVSMMSITKDLQEFMNYIFNF
ncbi:DeoR family transcriptional regulator [Enterococcus faecalis]|uniref:helix-turn-helix domain-containing protein n=1 Tax=Enterococcus faecalis TaxID=1351 RepID=UPI0018844AEC|nr:helix-turn-helix domain-containing protein [Enterococcus faecalis]MBE9855623.1 DeoR family transcriptional regulator [Enterococcus faecalis]